MIRPTKVEPRDGYRIWLRFQDGTVGEIDLSHLAGRGVFELWNERTCFETVCISSSGGVAWGRDVELCPDSLYMQLTGKCVEDVMPNARDLAADA